MLIERGWSKQVGEEAARCELRARLLRRPPPAGCTASPSPAARAPGVSHCVFSEFEGLHPTTQKKKKVGSVSKLN